MRLAWAGRVGVGLCLLAAAFADRIALATEPPPSRDAVAAKTAAQAADTAQANQLVSAAMQAEADGRNGQRKELLIQALEITPNLPAARWQAGYVSVNGQWQSVDDAGKPSTWNVTRDSYAALKKKTRDDAAGNFKLAKWCQDHKLADEARAHYLRVLTFNSDHAEARKALGYHPIAGWWLTKEEYAQIQANEKRLREAEIRWRPRIETIRAGFAQTNEPKRQAAEKDVLAIKDADAAGPLMRTLAGTNPQVDRLVVKVLGKLPGTEAALALTNYAIVHPETQIRDLAARQLHQRDVESYAPLLLATMYKPVAQHAIGKAPGGSGVTLRRTVVTERQYGVAANTQDVNKYIVTPAPPAPPMAPFARTGIDFASFVNVNPKSVRTVLVSDNGAIYEVPREDATPIPGISMAKTMNDIAQYNRQQLLKLPEIQRLPQELPQQLQPQLLQQQQQLVQQQQQYQLQLAFYQLQQNFYAMQLKQARLYLNQQAKMLDNEASVSDQQIAKDAQELNERIAVTLNIATDQCLSADPQVWWKWWEDYTTLKSGEKRVQTGYASSTSVVYQNQVPSNPIASPSPISPITSKDGGSRITVTPSDYINVAVISCFAAGTPVATVNGPRPIETIRIGDLVLSQNADTGELAYKPVLGTSIGPPTTFVKLKAGDETIQCTPNHLFWANGTGWTPARELAEGSYLHGVKGATPIGKVSQGETAKTYNLVVADLHTYFVGRERVLVHDNTMWKPAESLVPGMASAQPKLAVK